MPKLLLLCKGEVPHFFTNNLGPHWFRLRNATGLEAAKFITHEAGGSLSKSQDWTVIEVSEPNLDDVRELARAVKEGLTKEEDLAVALDSLNVPLHVLEEVARLMTDFDLTVVPVVDDDERMLGVITVDDVLEIVLPRGWRRNFRVFGDE